MKTFVQWAEENKAELPVYRQDERSSSRRSGIAWWAYPNGYMRSHYPDLYFTPYAADALFKLAPGPPITPYKHIVKHYTPPDYALSPEGEVEEPAAEYETD